jgi:hypothetical protein
MLQCEQCGLPLDAETVECCDNCGGVFCVKHINIMDDDAILCDDCALKWEDENGRGILGDSGGASGDD